MAANERLLEIEDLHVRIASERGVSHAVRGVSLHVDRDEVHCLVGESGCGKTMTALSVIGLLPTGARRSAGAIRLDGTELGMLRESDMRALRGAKMAMIFQDPMTALNPAFTIGTQLIDVLRHHTPAGNAQARERALYLLSRVGIRDGEERLRQYPHELSGGLRQRVMIAMALMCQPDLLLADEPTTALDVTIQMEVLLLLAELRREFKLGLLLVSHDLGLVAQIADRISVMYAGEIVETGRAADVIGNPLHPYTQGLIRCVPRPGLTARQSRLHTIPGTVQPIDESIVGCAFADRCELRHSECLGAAVPMSDFDSTRQYRCTLDAQGLRDAFGAGAAS